MEEERKRENEASLEAEAQPQGDTPEAEAPLLEEQPQEPPFDWQFGTETPMPEIEKKKKEPMGAKGFFIVFGAVLGICLALLVLVLFVGDEGFQIIRNLRTERVVYTEHGETPLSPSEAADRVAASTVTVLIRTEEGKPGIGSGFVYTADGYIVTNQHVVASAASVQVILPSGKTLDAVVHGVNKAADVAVLKVDATDLTPAVLGSSANLLEGEQVVAIGTPGKLDYAGTKTFGRISETRRLVLTYDATGTVNSKITMMQFDASVNPGNSGGPLADMNGKVVGVVVRKVSVISNTVYEGMGLALPIDGVKIIADAIIKNGEFNGKNPIVEGRSLLGVSGHTAKGGYWYTNEADPETGGFSAYPEETAGTHYVAKDGIYVTGVNGGNALQKMLAGDLILAVNGLRVYSIEELIAAVNRYYAGETVTLTVLRNGVEIDVNIILYEG